MRNVKERKMIDTDRRLDGTTLERVDRGNFSEEVLFQLRHE